MTSCSKYYIYDLTKKEFNYLTNLYSKYYIPSKTNCYRIEDYYGKYETTNHGIIYVCNLDRCENINGHWGLVLELYIEDLHFGFGSGVLPDVYYEQTIMSFDEAYKMKIFDYQIAKKIYDNNKLIQMHSNNN